MSDEIVVEELEKEGFHLKVVYDHDCPYSPREDDNMGNMVCFHSRYDLGDKHDLSVDEAKALMERKDVVFLELNLYDHSGITMSVSEEYPYNDQWDSSKVGIIYATYDEIRENYGIKRITKKVIERVKKHLTAEVEEYDCYLRGEVFGYYIEEDGEQVESCWGYIGDSDYAFSEGKSMLETLIDDKKAGEKLIAS